MKKQPSNIHSTNSTDTSYKKENHTKRHAGQSVRTRSKNSFPFDQIGAVHWGNIFKERLLTNSLSASFFNMYRAESVKRKKFLQRSYFLLTDRVFHTTMYRPNRPFGAVSYFAQIGRIHRDCSIKMQKRLRFGNKNYSRGKTVARTRDVIKQRKGFLIWVWYDLMWSETCRIVWFECDLISVLLGCIDLN